MLVTIFVPESSREFFQTKIDEYLDERNDTKEGPRYADRVNRIEEVSFNDPLEMVWTDDKHLLPERGTLAWWEVWVREELDDNFKYVARQLEIRQKAYYLRFPERTVRFVQAKAEQIERIILTTGSVAELRRAKDTPSSVLQSSPSRQGEISSELLARVEPPDANAPAVCLLDSGINFGHPLLDIAIDRDHAWAYLPEWGPHDGAIHGHGTQMAGLSLYGDLTPQLLGESPISLTHRLESVKIMPDDNVIPPDIDSYGYIYKNAVLKPEIDFPKGRRIYCSAVTNESPCDRGMPTGWSGAIDEICAAQEQRRLFVISAGNIDGGDVLYADDYPSANETSMICDPAQAWNALTVGAFTDLQAISETTYKDYKPLAPQGGLCPQSRTSLLWDRQWPTKPDIVLEGGNFASEPGGPHAKALDDLMLLTTNSEFQDAPFSTFGFTSGATAQAARMCAAIASDYPDLWPETVRALMIHCAEYTTEMLKYYDKHDEVKQRAFLARFGHGVPNLDRALRSVNNDLTMIVQGEIQPFVIRDSNARSNEIIYYDFPWPSGVLREHFDSNAYLRVTLSYYAEPNPARRGFAGRYRYASHGFRFAVRRPGELMSDFKQRVNDMERDEDYKAGPSDDAWFLKQDLRNRGSLISDTWEGTAAQLIDRATIAVYPIGGWWQSLKNKMRAERKTRFSLCVSLKVDDPAVDLYVPIELQIQQTIQTETH